MNFSFLICLLFAVLPLQAQLNETLKLSSLSTTDGKTYYNVTVTKITADTVRFIHSDGVSSVALNIIKQDSSYAEIFKKGDENAKQLQIEREKINNEEKVAKEAVYNEAQVLIKALKSKNPLTISQLIFLISYGNLNADQLTSILGPPTYVQTNVDLVTFNWVQRAITEGDPNSLLPYERTNQTTTLHVTYENGRLNCWGSKNGSLAYRYDLNKLVLHEPSYPSGDIEQRMKFKTVIDSINPSILNK